MPSYRITMTVGALHPGTRPADVVPAAAQAARDLTIVEAADVAVVAGQARVTVRFTAESTPVAVTVAEHVLATTGALVDLGAPTLTLRRAGRWLPTGQTWRTDGDLIT